MDDTAKISKKMRAGRSPSYPAIDIQTALKRAQELYDQSQHHYSPVDIVSKHWRYAPGSGAATGNIAALIRYGLLVAEGAAKERKVRLTDFALDIIKDKRSDSRERNQRVKEAALKPKIHTEIYERYGYNLVSDEDLLYELERNKNFTSNGAREFVSQYKRTLEFIRELVSDEIAPDESVGERQVDTSLTEDQVGETRVDAPVSPKEPNVRTIKIPMLEGVWPTLTAQFPMAKDDWDYMIKVLTTMEPKLVKAEPQFQEIEVETEGELENP